ncbi:hypothetical protein AC792_13380 [Arthrobacter sp. RIT-PI-e]|nr:hypothetical protein AC792_13380 [Arthrobacter sp. RIT-PI-e]
MHGGFDGGARVDRTHRWARSGVLARHGRDERDVSALCARTRPQPALHRSRADGPRDEPPHGPAAPAGDHPGYVRHGDAPPPPPVCARPGGIGGPCERGRAPRPDGAARRPRTRRGRVGVLPAAPLVLQLVVVGGAPPFRSPATGSRSDTAAVRPGRRVPSRTFSGGHGPP